METPQPTAETQRESFTPEGLMQRLKDLLFKYGSRREAIPPKPESGESMINMIEMKSNITGKNFLEYGRNGGNKVMGEDKHPIPITGGDIKPNTITGSTKKGRGESTEIEADHEIHKVLVERSGSSGEIEIYVDIERLCEWANGQENPRNAWIDDGFLAKIISYLLELKGPRSVSSDGGITVVNGKNGEELKVPIQVLARLFH